MEYVHAEFSEAVGLSEIAEIIGVHPAHLAKVFRLHFNCTLGEYVRQLRLDYAEKELVRSEKTLSEIAFSAGFYDQSHFTNTFKIRFGLPPSEYRLLRQKHKIYH